MRPDHVVRAIAREAAVASAQRQNCEESRVFISPTDVATDVVDALYLRGCFDQSALISAGDALQSAASRLAAGVRRIGADRALGYEDSMALRVVESAVADWTEARR
jgi:hypothetical protein